MRYILCILYSLVTILLCTFSYLDLVANQHIYTNSLLGNGLTWFVWVIISWMLLKIKKYSIYW